MKKRAKGVGITYLKTRTFNVCNPNKPRVGWVSNMTCLLLHHNRVTKCHIHVLPALFK